ncbi:hypothetical protein SAMN04488505_103132 [Chitinophaga rupis]|uniref:Uncharacterized protein n=1 Tax=Chitinophaga rupis TaxID=573321 RepID=A0A1H7UX99_9BACT|nr:hypothetical protein [Chitinophaga rupis]SEM01295.1 hypothetical protein SAMN04488505_103132 [Chitinophaga rupis]
MTDMNDEQLQRMLEEGAPIPPDSEELQAYKMLFNALQQPLSVHVPNRFASRVSMRIQAKRERVSNLRFYLLIAAIIFCSAAVTAGMLLAFAPATAVSILGVIIAKKWLFIFSAGALTAIQLADKWLLKKTTAKLMDEY